MGLLEDCGEFDEICNSDRCNIVVVYVIISNMFICLLSLGGLLFSELLKFSMLLVVIGIEGMLSRVDEFFNRFVKVIVLLNDVLCILCVKA